MNLEAMHDFVRLYYLKCGEYRTKKEAYEACEEEYKKQHKRHIELGLMKETRFSGYDTFMVRLNEWFKNPKNKKRIET